MRRPECRPAGDQGCPSFPHQAGAEQVQGARGGQGISASVVRVTHTPDDPYENYIRGIKGGPIACKVKVADIMHNLSDASNTQQIRKHVAALLALVD